MLLDYRQIGNTNMNLGKTIFEFILLLMMLQNFDMPFFGKITSEI